MTKKKPDQVVYNEEKGKYDAALTPYATNLGAPAIVTDDVTSWKNSNISKVNHQFKTEYEELKAQYEVMIKKFEYNNLIYAAKFSFEPIVGAIYHLYRSKSGEPFLSLISPEECNWDFAGTFELKADKIWNRLDTPKEEEDENEE